MLEGSNSPLPALMLQSRAEFRTRLVEGQAEEHLLTVMLALFKERGWLKARGKQRTDSTQVLAKIRAINRLVCGGETLRHALNCLAIVAPEWLLARGGTSCSDQALGLGSVTSSGCLKYVSGFASSIRKDGEPFVASPTITAKLRV